MKTRPTPTARTGPRRARFAFHPLSFAICLGLSGTALALPQGGKVVAGEATIGKPNPTTQVINQSTDKAIIDWKSFSIGSGEKVRFYQPSRSSVTLNRVTGYDPSHILGEMSANGKIFLVNPYGVVFGAGARVDVGGLVVSTLSIANNDFLASHYSLTSVDPAAPAQRGEIRNDGTISAPGGTVVLAGPSVTNSGTIVANGGRVGLVAAQAVSVDVEGDGLLFFQTTATEARNRLQQLGRIQADGGTVEMRAAARGAFADTVLNMTGVVQARTLGAREGRIVIDGGAEGITAVSGRLDASGLATGERGGSVIVQGQKVLIDRGARVDASGDARGGTILVGGDFQGTNPDVRNAEETIVMPGAELRADAVTRGNGGKVVVWADNATTFNGSILARGGAERGDGGFVETSGKHGLSIAVGHVDASAAAGKPGTWLLDPDNIIVADIGTATTGDVDTFGANPGTTQSISPLTLDSAGTSVVLQAENNITFTDPVALQTPGAGLTALAGNSIFVNASITTTNGAILLSAVDPGAGLPIPTGVLSIGFALDSGTALTTLRTAGTAGIALAASTTAGQILFETSDAPVLQTAGVLTIAGLTTIDAGTGAVTLNTAANQMTGTISSTGTGAVIIRNGIATQLGAIGAAGNSAASLDVGTSNDAVTQTAAAFVAGTTTVAAGTGAVTLDAAANQLAGAVSSTGTGAVTLVNTVATQLGAIGAAGNSAASLDVGTSNDAVTQTAAAFVAGTTTVAAGTAAVTLDAAANQLAGAVSSTGTGAVTLVNTVATQLGAIGASGTPAASLDVTTSDDAVTQNADVFVAGATTVNSGTGNITLSRVGNDFQGAVSLTGGALSVADANNLNITTLVNAGNLSVTAIAQGTLTLPVAAIDASAGDLDLRSLGGALATPGVLSGQNVTLVGSGGVDLADDVTAAVNLSLTATDNAIAQSGGSVLQVTGTTTASAGTGAVTLDTATNQMTGAISSTGSGAVTIVNSIATQLGAIGTAGTPAASLTVTTSNDAVTQNADVFVAGATTVNSGTGNITLSRVGNDFQGAVSLTGGALSVADANNLNITTLVNAGNLSVTAIAQGTLTLPVAAIDASAGDLDLRSLGGALATPGVLSGQNVTLVGSGGVDLADDVTAAVNLSLTATDNAIAQSGGSVLQVTGTTTASAGTGAVTLDTATNQMTGAISSTGSGAVTIVNSIATQLGAIGTAGTPAASLTVTTSNDAVTQNADVFVAGATTVNSGTGNITLSRVGNDFQGAVSLTGGALSVADANNLNITTLVNAGNLSVTAIAQGTLTLPVVPINASAGNLDLRSLGGSLTTAGDLTAGTISLTGATGLTLASTLNATDVTLNTTNAAITQPGGVINATGATTFNTGSGAVTLGQANLLNSIGGSGGTVNVSEASAGGVALDATSATSLTVTTTVAAAPVTQNAPLIVSGATTINAGTGTGSVTLANGSNNFGSFGATAGAVNVSDSGAIILNAINAATLTVDTSAGDGTVTQTAPLNVSGATTVDAGNGAVTLGAANTLGSFGATGGLVSLTENSVNGIALDDVTATGLTVNTSAANGNVTQTALRTLAVSGATAVNAGTGSVAFLNSGNTLGSFGATAGAVSVADSNALALDATIATSLTVDTSAGNGAVTQNAAAVVSGATVVTSGSGPITLNNAGNNFSNLPGNSFTGGAISLRDANDLTVTVLANAPNQAVSVIAGGSLTLPGGVATGTADLTLSSGALLSTPGTLSGNDISLTGSAGINVGNDVTATGNLTLTTANAAVNQTLGRIVSGGTTTVTAGAGTVTLAQGLNDFNSIDVVSGSVVTVVDSTALTAAANATGALTITSTGPLSSGGSLSGSNVALTGNAGINLAHNVTATGTLQLSTSNAAIDQTAGAITVANLTTASAGSGDITLNQAGNDFSNLAGVNASGGAVRLQDVNALVIAGLVNGANEDLSLTAGTTITGLAGNIDTGSADLSITAGAGFTTFGTLRGTNVTLGGGTGGVSIGHDVTALANLALNATNSAITQTAGSIAAAGTTTASAGTGSITLALAGNNFATFAATGNAVTVRDDNGLALGPVTATTLSLNTSGGNGAVTQSGASVVSGTTTISAGSGAVTLTNAGNNFANIGVSGGAVAITDLDALALNAINATSLTVDTSAGNGPVTQNAAAVVSGATAVNAGGGAVSLSNVGNNFGSVGATGGAVSIVDVDALALGATSATSLTVTAGGAVTQNAGVVVSGATSVNAGANAITLGNAGNNFGSVGATGGAVSITDSNALALDAINASSLTLNTAAGNGAVSQNAAAIVSGATTVNAGSGAVALINAGNNFGSVAAIGGAVSVTDVNALTLGAIAATSLTVNTSAGNGAITQSAAAVVSVASNINAGSGAVTLANAGNDFATLGVIGGATSIVDANTLTLSLLAIAPNQAVSVSTGGTLTLPAAPIDTGSASLTLASGGTLTTVDTLRGTNVALSSAGAMTLANDVTALGTLGLTTTNAPILQTGGSIVAAGTTTVSAGSGDITLAQPTNDFQGNLLLSGGAVTVRDVNNLAVTSLVSGANRPVSLIAGGSLSLPAAPIDTGTADLTLQSLGGSLVINGALSGNNVTLTGTTGLTLGANVTSSGDQIYTTAVQLSGNVTLDAGASRIDLQGGANGGGNSLALTSSNAAADAIRTGAAVSNTAQFTVSGNSTLGGNVTTTGNQTYTGPVTLGTDVTLAAGAARIDLQSTVNAAGNDLALTSSNAAADAIRAAGVISNAAQLTVTGKSTFASGVVTTGAQLYSDTVTLGNTANFVGSSLGFGNGIVAGSFDLGLQSDALNLAGTVSGSGNATLSSLTQSATVGIAGGAGTYQLSQATLDRFASFTSLTIGRADGTGDLSFGNLVLPTHLAVRSSSGDADFTGTVASAAGQARNLSVTTGGTTTFSGAVGGAIGGTAALGNLSVAGATQLDASTTANGTVSLAGPVTVGADATLSAAAIALGGSLDIGTRAVTLLSDSLSVAGPATGSGAGSVRIAAKDATGSIGVAGGAGTLQVSQGLVDTFAGVPTLSLGRSDSTGTITVGNLTLPTDIAIGNGSGNVAFTGTLDSAAGPARDLSVTTTGTTSFAGPVGATRALDALTVAGTSQLGASIVTTGAQTYTGASTLVVDSTLSGPSVSFGSTVDGARALTVNAAATNFAGAVGSTVALTSLTTDAAGTTQLGGNVTTSGGQTYNDALQLNGDAVLSGTALNLAGTVDGARTLTVNGSIGVTLGSAIGAGTALSGLSITGPLQLNAGTVTTTGAQSYAGATTLGAATTLTAASLAFGNTLDGGFALTLQSAGPTSFASAVGATTALASLTASGGGAVQLAGPSIDTTGAQSYSGALQVAGNARLTGSALSLTGAVSGAADLTLQTNALNGGTAIAGTGVLTIAPVDPTLAIGIAGGAGALQVSQAVLDGATGFSSHVIGRSDGSGSVSAGNLQLRANTTLQTATGDLNLGGSVDGGFALTLNSGGTTRITGPVGAGTALASLTTDNDTAATDWNGTTGERTTFDTADGTGSARVITSGAQTYGDPVTATVPVVFNGGAITATQATNRFDGIVSANAISLDLRNSTDLRLGTMTLLNGGSLETDGVLHVTGALQLNGGVLTLTSNATPTSIDLSDPEFAGKTLSFGFVPIQEASATIVQDAGGTIGSAAGSLLVLRSPAGGSLILEQPGNNLLGQVSAVSGTLGDNDVSRFNNAIGTLTLGFIRIVSSELHVAGQPPSNGDQTLAQAGLEGDVIKLTADVLTTGTDGLIRARLPFNNIQGSTTSIPGLTLAMSPNALLNGGGFGAPEPDTYIQVRVGASEGGFLTARPKGVSGDTAVIFLGGDTSVTPFYDGAGKITEIRIFYNGNAPRTPQEAGALAAVIALIEDARQARFEEAVRTENVRSRLRSGVIAEVGAGRPATVGRESIRLPDTCEIKPKTLQCE